MDDATGPAGRPTEPYWMHTRCIHVSDRKEYRNVRLDVEAYRRLASRKREDESFSDVVKREIGERPIAELAGVLSDEEAEDLRADVRALRERADEELMEREVGDRTVRGEERR